MIIFILGPAVFATSAGPEVGGKGRNWLESSSAGKAEPWSAREGSSFTHCRDGSTTSDSREGFTSFTSYPQRRDGAVPVVFLKPNWIYVFVLLKHTTILK